jgi:hypothetical protein
MKWIKLFLLVAICGSVASNLQASIIQIDDLTDTLSLIIDGVTITGNGGKVSNYSNTFDPATSTEKLQFTFTSTRKAGADLKLYARMICTGCPEESSTGGTSDLFLFVATKGSFQAAITFKSSDTSSELVPPAGYTRIANTDPVEENGKYQILLTNVATDSDKIIDQYQARSDFTPPLPEPSTLFLFVGGLGCLGLWAWRQSSPDYCASSSARCRALWREIRQQIGTESARDSRELEL